MIMMPLFHHVPLATIQRFIIVQAMVSSLSHNHKQRKGKQKKIGIALEGQPPNSSHGLSLGTSKVLSLFFFVISVLNVFWDSTVKRVQIVTAFYKIIGGL
jgi:hypothetical protein